MQNLNKIIIKNRQDSKLIEGSPWIYSNSIENISDLKKIENGSLVFVKLHNENNNFAIAYFNIHQLITARILSYDVNENIDAAFFEKKILAAKKLRDQFFNKPYYRLIHSEADSLPGLVIDRFDDIFSCQITTLGMQKLEHFIIEALKNIFNDCKIIFRNDADSRKYEGLELEIKNINEINDEKIIEENDIQFKINIITGQKTGWYFDQRKNREFIANCSENKDVLDAFCYHGSFGIYALSKNARSVTFIDSSQTAIESAKNNIEINKLDNSRCDFICDKVFDRFEKMLKEERKFDIILLDPPAFVKSRKDLHSGLKGYEKLVKLAIPLLRENGMIFLASCSHNVSLDDLTSCANKAVRKFYNNKRSPKLIRSFGADIDHPLHPSLRESEYLKSIAFFV